mmetsp:Transcript_41219/g.94813  ORF Transcript_41219/g.94813 Transcript_41219/m.94813 type:complete len:252 (+) Transcript_41219:65-820(+)
MSGWRAQGWSGSSTTNSQWPLRAVDCDTEACMSQLRLDHLPLAARRHAREAMVGSPKVEAYTRMLQVIDGNRLGEVEGFATSSSSGSSAPRAKSSGAPQRPSRHESTVGSDKETLRNMLRASTQKLLTDVRIAYDEVDDPVAQAEYASHQVERALHWHDQSSMRTVMSASTPDFSKASPFSQQHQPRWLSFDPLDPPVGSAKRQAGGNKMSEVAVGMAGSIAIGPRRRVRAPMPSAPWPRFGGLVQSIKKY